MGPALALVRAALPQRFAWTEADLPLRKARRLAGTPLLHQQQEELSREPMFCYESALKLCYW